MDRYQVREGTEVYSTDGDKVGSVVAVQPNHIVVEKGFFFPTDYYIPTTAITSAEGDKVYLNVSKDQALNQGWDIEPTRDYGATSGSETRTTSAAGETLRVPVHEEELTATKRQRKLGEVRVEKDVVSEERVLDVPVTEERVRVERRVVDRPLGEDEGAFEEGTIKVPIRGEEVEVQKRARVAEEVEISKEAVERTERVGGTVRREEVRIDEDADGARREAERDMSEDADDAEGRDR